MPTFPIDHPRFGPCLALSAGGAGALVGLHGGQVLSWRARGADRLFLGDAAVGGAGIAVRGGIPVIFPQFAQHGDGPRHGFARTATWDVAEAGATSATLALGPSAATLAAWPHPFALTLRIALGDDRLDLELSVGNPGPAPFSFAAALHAYLAVDGGDPVLPAGLAGHPFADRSESADDRGAAAALDLDRETERLYRDVPADLTWRLPAPVELASDGWPDLMVWNPGRAKAAALPDLAPGDHRRFLCVEPLHFAPVTLAAGATWRARHRLRVPA